MQARAGAQGAALAKWRRNTVPSPASRSTLGVFTTAFPAMPSASPRHWSQVTNRMLGRDLRLAMKFPD